MVLYNENGLTEFQQALVDEWLRNKGNGTHAYLSIKPNASEEVAASEASTTLRIPKVQAYVIKRQHDIRHKAELSQEWVYEQERILANQDLANILDPETLQCKSPFELPEEVRLAISSFDIQEVDTSDPADPLYDGPVIEKRWKYKFYNKDKALERIQKCLGMQIDKKEHSGPDGGPIEISDPEAEMKRRGLPVPEIGINDLEVDPLK